MNQKKIFYWFNGLLYFFTRFSKARDILPDCSFYQIFHLVKTTNPILSLDDGHVDELYKKRYYFEQIKGNKLQSFSYIQNNIISGWNVYDFFYRKSSYVDLIVMPRSFSSGLVSVYLASPEIFSPLPTSQSLARGKEVHPLKKNSKKEEYRLSPQRWFRPWRRASRWGWTFRDRRGRWRTCCGCSAGGSSERGSRRLKSSPENLI